MIFTLTSKGFALALPPHPSSLIGDYNFRNPPPSVVVVDPPSHSSDVQIPILNPMKVISLDMFDRI